MSAKNSTTVRRGMLSATALLLVAATGCGTSTGGVPVEQTPTKETAFDPCSIADEALVAAGLDPATEVDDVGPGFVISDSNICSWDSSGSSPWYSVSIHFSWVSDVATTTARTGFVDFRPVEIGSRHGLQFRFERTDVSRGCIVSFDVEGGLISVDLETFGSKQPVAETCTVLDNVVESLDTQFPVQ